MAYPTWHALATLPVAAMAWPMAHTRGLLAALAGGVLIDADHMVDWALSDGRPDYRTHIVLPLHGWEFPLGLLWWARRHGPAWTGPLAAAWLVHLCLDWLVNLPSRPQSYLLSRRLVVGFRRGASGWPPPRALPGRFKRRFYAAPREASVAALAGILALALLQRRMNHRAAPGL